MSCFWALFGHAASAVSVDGAKLTSRLGALVRYFRALGRPIRRMAYEIHQ